MEKLTEKQEYILQILKQLKAKNGYSPTVREIGEAANLHSPATIHFHLQQLEEKGFIKKNSKKKCKKYIPDDLQAAYFQLVYFPTVASANVTRMQIYSGLNKYFAEQKSEYSIFGKFFSSKTCNAVLPTNPVAPTIANL